MSKDIYALIHNASEALSKLEIAVRYAATISMARECEEADIEWRYSRLTSRLLEAASDLGYTLTPLKEAPHVAGTQDQPDSGRLSSVPQSPAPFSENYGA